MTTTDVTAPTAASLDEMVNHDDEVVQELNQLLAEMRAEVEARSDRKKGMPGWVAKMLSHDDFVYAPSSKVEKQVRDAYTDLTTRCARNEDLERERQAAVTDGFGGSPLGDTLNRPIGIWDRGDAIHDLQQALACVLVYGVLRTHGATIDSARLVPLSGAIRKAVMNPDVALEKAFLVEAFHVERELEALGLVAPKPRS